MTRAQLTRIAKCGALLGIAGGLAEVFWIASYGWVAGVDAAEVARGVTAAVAWLLPANPLLAAPVIAGLAIHMALAIAIGVGLVLLWQLATGQGTARANEFVFMVAALIVIWTLNFFVVLPLISPDFVALVPYPVSLISKVLFGLASATVLQSTGRDRVPVILRAQAR